MTNHALVLWQVWLTPRITIKVIAKRVEISERATLRIIGELVREGYLSHQRVGRMNEYVVSDNHEMRHPITRHIAIGRLLALIQPPSNSE